MDTIRRSFLRGLAALVGSPSIIKKLPEQTGPVEVGSAWNDSAVVKVDSAEQVGLDHAWSSRPHRVQGINGTFRLDDGRWHFMRNFDISVTQDWLKPAVGEPLIATTREWALDVFLEASPPELKCKIHEKHRVELEMTEDICYVGRAQLIGFSEFSPVPSLWNYQFVGEGELRFFDRRKNDQRGQSDDV